MANCVINEQINNCVYVVVLVDSGKERRESNAMLDKHMFYQFLFYTSLMIWIWMLVKLLLAAARRISIF